MFARIENLRHRYDTQWLLDIHCAEFPKGQITALTGPNGCGKTTLLEILSLLRRPTQGEVFLWNSPQPARPGHGDPRVVMAMHPSVLFRGSVWRNLCYGLSCRGYRGRQARDMVGKVTSKLRIGDLVHRSVLTLSAGQRQRVNLARAIVLRGDPWALLLDEPLANVDTESAEIIREMLLELRDEGATILMTSPAGVPLPDITDRTLELREGELVTS